MNIMREDARSRVLQQPIITHGYLLKSSHYLGIISTLRLFFVFAIPFTEGIYLCFDKPS